jgi:hypothetical protein
VCKANNEVGTTEYSLFDSWIVFRRECLEMSVRSVKALLVELKHMNKKLMKCTCEFMVLYCIFSNTKTVSTPKQTTLVVKHMKNNLA